MFNFNKYLPNDEEALEIIHSIQASLYLKLFLALIIFLTPFFLMIPILSLGIKGITLSLLVISLDLFFVFKSYNKWAYNCIILTEKKLYRFHQEGFLKRGVKEFYLDNIDKIDIEYNGLISKIFRVGDLVIYLKNNKYVDLDDISNIKRVKNRIWEVIN